MGSLGAAVFAPTQYQQQAAIKGGIISCKPGAGHGGHHHQQQQEEGLLFRMPLHYPRYKKADYEAMPEWRLDCLLREYGLPDVVGGVDDKRRFAMGAFLWPDQYY
ncbi:hypothetical protein PR202_gb29758 [Eleusine coracana subsp. coracana]|uniref:DUF7722 domain-containing protein n=1 Tax=Eleusine coracana subsp. coracana TaxID=191504 RepID=A0AAV5G164_ELECO|nr:hypothetical protein QOZ80_8BG0662550 [Eleusine coracana subsp. coracana]GJN40530.1 hypothetical protein PR202_gb29758 [Eleusine coracana subsp. coracana]